MPGYFDSCCVRRVPSILRVNTIALSKASAFADSKEILHDTYCPNVTPTRPFAEDNHTSNNSMK